MQKSFPPLIQSTTQTLVLGSAPSVTSLIKKEYYAGPGNHFWSILGHFFHFSKNQSYENRCNILKNAQIGLWDVFATFNRKGSLDSAFTSTTATALEDILLSYPIQLLIINGKKAAKEIEKSSSVGEKLILNCPSTSGANNGQKQLREKQWYIALCIHHLLTHSPLKTFQIQFGNTENIRKEAYNLRREIFVTEQGIDESLEFDAIDHSRECAYFFLSHPINKGIATIRFQQKEEKGIQPDRFCLKKSFRGQGIGRALLQLYEYYALFEGFLYSELSAEEEVIDFYKKCGYFINSEAFIEDGITCFKMKKELTLPFFNPIP